MTFTKGDPRINRKGRPRSFDKLRELAQKLGAEIAKTPGPDGKPIVLDGHTLTQIEMILRNMMHTNPERFIEIAYGKVPQPVEHTGAEGGAITLRVVRDMESGSRIPDPSTQAARETGGN